MPELPDVEVFRRYFDSTSLKQRVAQVDVHDQRILEGVSARLLNDALTGREFVSTTRHGKYMFAETDGDDWVILHFGMTGYLSYQQCDNEAPTHTRVLVSFENGYCLAFVNQRLLGMAGLTRDPHQFIQGKKLGPDALSTDTGQFRELLSDRRGTVKAALTNQEVLAGIGNIYADEILFQSRIHPKTQLQSLSDSDLNTLHEQMGVVCQEAINARVDVGQMPDWFLLRRREKGAGCPRCGAPIKTMKVSSRTAYYCPSCQTAQ